MEFTHEKLGKCVLTDLTQKRLEDLTREMQGKEKETLTVFRGDSVRIAIKLGILTEPEMTVDDVDEAKPSLIHWLADCIGELIAEALNIDPLS